MNDRTVHANLPDGGEVARYDRSGKWYVECPQDSGRKRRAIKLSEAVELAQTGRVHLKRSGGLAFDAAYRRAVAGAQ